MKGTYQIKWHKDAKPFSFSTSHRLAIPLLKAIYRARAEMNGRVGGDKEGGAD